jgi:hypothetical protein
MPFSIKSGTFIFIFLCYSSRIFYAVETIILLCGKFGLRPAISDSLSWVILPWEFFLIPSYPPIIGYGYLGDLYCLIFSNTTFLFESWLIGYSIPEIILVSYSFVCLNLSTDSSIEL